jgi:itaconate CoA-transferase
MRNPLYGITVIKIERSGAGDFARDYDHTTLGQSSYFASLNRGKESIQLDLKDSGDRDLLLRLVAISVTRHRVR